MPPRASTPVGIALLDKPPGTSSFALVAELRRRTGARTGHAGTLDPFASGLLVLLSGSATRLAPCFVGLDKRYVTTVDLTSTTSTGDPEGEELERHAAPSQNELDARLAALRGEVELPIPAASAVKIGGERAYRLARRGVQVEMPLRRSSVYALDVITYMGDQVELGLHVGSGTYVRSIAAALGGHCIALRRTAVGPFLLEEADADRFLPVLEALGRLPAEALERVPYGLRAQVLAFEAEVAGGTVLPSLPDVENAEWEPIDEGPEAGGAP
jgi:tRNA pseudouridine55 synthase